DLQAVSPGQLSLHPVQRMSILIIDIITIKPAEQALFEVHFHVPSLLSLYEQENGMTSSDHAAFQSPSKLDKLFYVNDKDRCAPDLYFHRERSISADIIGRRAWDYLCAAAAVFSDYFDRAFDPVILCTDDQRRVAGSEKTASSGKTGHLIIFLGQ